MGSVYEDNRMPDHTDMRWPMLRLSLARQMTTYTVNHFVRPRGARRNRTRFLRTFATYGEAKAKFDRIVSRVTARTKKQYHKWDELKWHDQRICTRDLFQVYDDRGEADPYLEDTTIETVMIEAEASNG